MQRLLGNTPLASTVAPPSTGDMYVIEIPDSGKSSESLPSEGLPVEYTSTSSPSVVSSESKRDLSLSSSSLFMVPSPSEEDESRQPSRTFCDKITAKCSGAAYYFRTRILFYHSGTSRTQKMMQTAASLYAGFEARKAALVLVGSFISLEVTAGLICAEIVADLLASIFFYHTQKGISECITKFNLFDPRFEAQEEINQRQTAAIKKLKNLENVFFDIIEELSPATTSVAKKIQLRRDTERALGQITATLLEEDKKEKKTKRGRCATCSESLCKCIEKVSSCCGMRSGKR